MAYAYSQTFTWSAYPNGDTGLNIRTAINENMDHLGEVSTLASANYDRLQVMNSNGIEGATKATIGDVTAGTDNTKLVPADVLSTHTANFIDITDTDLMFLGKAGTTAHVLTTAFSIVEFAGIEQYNSGNGHLTYNGTSDQLTFVSAGVYKIRADGVIVLAGGTDTITFSFFLDGVEQGVGVQPEFDVTSSKQVHVGSATVIVATAAQVLDIRAKAASGATLNIVSGNFSIEKTPYA